MIISIINQKGGVAKTTSTFSLAECLREKGKKVLMVDLDPQASLTISTGIEPEEIQKTIYSVLCENVSIKEAMIDLNKYYLVPSIIDLSVAEIQLVSEYGREYLLKTALSLVENDFDFILIDCPPSLGLLTVNALCASDKVIIPVTTEYLALRGIKLLMSTIDRVKKLNSKMEILGIIPTMYDPRTLHGNEVLESLKKDYPNLVFEPVTKSIKVSDSILAATNIVESNPTHKISEAYRKVAEVIVNG